MVVLTNGTLLRDHAEALGRWPRDRFHLQISLDGLKPRHDEVRGKGSFDTLIANLAWLKARKNPFTLSMCVNADNVADMPGVVDLAAETGAANVHFMWFFVRGRGNPPAVCSAGENLSLSGRGCQARRSCEHKYRQF